MTRWTTAVVVTAAAVAGGPARGAYTYATGFEAPNFTANATLTGTDGWTSVGFLSPSAATISTAQPAGGTQGVRIRGADLVPDPLVNGAGYEAVGSYRKPVNVDVLATASPIVRVQAAVRLDGPTTAQTPDRVTGDFASVNLALISADGSIGELSLSSDGRVYGYAADFNDLYLFGAVRPLGTYYTLAVEANFLTKTVTFSVDGLVLGSRSFADPAFGLSSSVVARGSVAMYANLPPGPGGVTRSQYTSYFDDFRITASPTPAPPTAVAAVAGLLGLAGVRWRR